MGGCWLLKLAKITSKRVFVDGVDVFPSWERL